MGREEHKPTARDKSNVVAEAQAAYAAEATRKLPIALPLPEIAEFCRKRGIRKLSLFGSVLRDDFDPQRSDVDVLVELMPDAHPGWEFFGWAEDLANIIGHKVDLCSRLNKYIEDEVRREAVTVYEQA